MLTQTRGFEGTSTWMRGWVSDAFPGKPATMGGRIATFLTLLTFSLLQRSQFHTRLKNRKRGTWSVLIVWNMWLRGRGVLYTLLAVSLTLTNPITSPDNDSCTLVVLIFSSLLLSVLTYYSYTLFTYVLVTSSQVILIQWVQNMLSNGQLTV